MNLKTFTYTSWSRPSIRADEVDAILRSSRVNNPLDGITGLLMFNGSAFMQVLEGSVAAVDDLVTCLRLDPRHSNISVRHDAIIEHRIFPDWSMGYLRLEDGMFQGHPEVVRAVQRDLPDHLRNLVSSFTGSVPAYYQTNQYRL